MPKAHLDFSDGFGGCRLDLKDCAVGSSNHTGLGQCFFGGHYTAFFAAAESFKTAGANMACVRLVIAAETTCPEKIAIACAVCDH